MFRIMQFNGLAKNLINSEKMQKCLQEADFYEDIKSYLETIGFFLNLI